MGSPALQLSPIQFIAETDQKSGKDYYEYSIYTHGAGTKTPAIMGRTEFHSSAATIKNAISDFFDTHAKHPHGTMWWKQSYNDSVVIPPDASGKNLILVFDDDDEGLYGDYVGNGIRFALDDRGDVTIHILTEHEYDVTWRGNGQCLSAQIVNAFNDPNGGGKAKKTNFKVTEIEEINKLIAGLMSISSRTTKGSESCLNQNDQIAHAYLTFMKNTVESLRQRRDTTGITAGDKTKAESDINKYTELLLTHFGREVVNQYLFNTSTGENAAEASFSGASPRGSNMVEEHLARHQAELQAIKSNTQLNATQKIQALDKLFGPMRSITGLQAKDRDAFFTEEYYPAYRRELISIVQAAAPQDKKASINDTTFPDFRDKITESGEDNQYNRRIAITEKVITEILKEAGLASAISAPNQVPTVNGIDYTRKLDELNKSNPLIIQFNGSGVSIDNTTRNIFINALKTHLTRDPSIQRALAAQKPDLALVTRLFLSAIESDPNSGHRLKNPANKAIIEALVAQLLTKT